VFPVLIAVFAVTSIPRPAAPTALLGGVAAGVALGFLGLRLTRFEVTPQGLYYTPSAHLGIGLSVLLIGRLGYRAMQLYSGPGVSDASTPMPAAGSPLTLLIFGALAGYYISYAGGLLRWRHGVANTTVQSAAPSQPQP
jgi:hypothetical protein